MDNLSNVIIMCNSIKVHQESQVVINLPFNIYISFVTQHHVCLGGLGLKLQFCSFYDNYHSNL